jgi:acyl-CoA thioester hydrolase
MWHTTTFNVRYAETDQMGMVHHSNYIVWMEEGRSALMRALGSSYAEFEADGYYLAVSEVHARYLAPARYDRAVTVRTRIAEVRSRTVTFDYEIADTHTGQLLVTAQTRHICINHAGSVAAIPMTWRQRLAVELNNP